MRNRNPRKHHFDAFRNYVVAPNHVLGGIIRDILRSIFQSLPDNNIRMIQNDVLKTNVTKHKLPYESPVVYNSRGRKGDLNNT